MQQLQPRTRSGLLPEARHLILPRGIRSSGFPSVRETCRSIGIEFDAWQQGLNRCLLAKNEQRLYAADIAVLSIARQVGKTWDVGAVAFALCIAIPGLTVVWTAHRFKVARESFNELRAFAKSSLLVPHIEFDDITTAAGNECIPFRNGSRIVFAARERGSIRGFTKVGLLVLDEAQILTEAALSDLAPTTNQAANPLIILMGTPPKPTDPSEVFVRLRQEALAGESEDVLYVELSADEDADPDDREQWSKANPSYPKRTPERAILRLKKLLSHDDFLREGLGIWDQDGLGILPGWARLFVDVVPPPPTAVGLAVSIDSAWGSIASADLWDDERINLSAVDRRPGTAWLVGEAKRIQAERNCAVVVDEKCPDGTLVEALDVAGVDVTVMKLADLVSACSEVVNRVREGTVTHQRTTELDAAIDVADWRDVGDGRRVFGRKKSSGPVDMLEAATAAMWGALNPRMPAIY